MLIDVEQGFMLRPLYTPGEILRCQSHDTTVQRTASIQTLNSEFRRYGMRLLIQTSGFPIQPPFQDLARLKLNHNTSIRKTPAPRPRLGSYR